MSNHSCNIDSLNRNRKLQTSKAPLKSQAQGTSLFTSAVSNQRGFPIVRERLRSGCQRVRECVKSEGFSKSSIQPLRRYPLRTYNVVLRLQSVMMADVWWCRSGTGIRYLKESSA